MILNLNKDHIMKLTNLFTFKTRAALRSQVKLMKQSGLNVTSNERTRAKGDQWAVMVLQPIKTRKKRFTVQNNRLMSKFNLVSYSL